VGVPFREPDSQVLIEVPLSPVTGDIRYNGVKLMKAMQQRRDHVLIAQCKQN
jgi:hypothetical protein